MTIRFAFRMVSSPNSQSLTQVACTPGFIHSGEITLLTALVAATRISASLAAAWDDSIGTTGSPTKPLHLFSKLIAIRFGRAINVDLLDRTHRAKSRHVGAGLPARAEDCHDC